MLVTKSFEDFRGDVGYAPSPARILAAAPSFPFSFSLPIVARSSVDIAVASLPATPASAASRHEMDRLEGEELLVEHG